MLLIRSLFVPHETDADSLLQMCGKTLRQSRSPILSKQMRFFM